MGERSWGKGSVQNIIELEHGKSALKLTTAAYRRPSGKNIHRFPDAKDKDEWGVMPDLGYELGLDDRETRALAADRRQRDIIAAHATDDKSAAVIKDEPLARRQTSDKPDAESKIVRRMPSQSTAAKKPFVDRQFEMAMKYLRDKLLSRVGQDRRGTRMRGRDPGPPRSNAIQVGGPSLARLLVPPYNSAPRSKLAAPCTFSPSRPPATKRRPRSLPTGSK